MVRFPLSGTTSLRSAVSASVADIMRLFIMFGCCRRSVTQLDVSRQHAPPNRAEVALGALMLRLRRMRLALM